MWSEIKSRRGMETIRVRPFAVFDRVVRAGDI